MSTTVLEALQNAEINFRNADKLGGGNHPFFQIAFMQLKNALKAIEKGKELNEVMQENIFDDVDDIDGEET